jgi:hypothetical protein
MHISSLQGPVIKFFTKSQVRSFLSLTLSLTALKPISHISLTLNQAAIWINVAVQLEVINDFSGDQ